MACIAALATSQQIEALPDPTPGEEFYNVAPLIPKSQAIASPPCPDVTLKQRSTLPERSTASSSVTPKIAMPLECAHKCAPRGKDGERRTSQNHFNPLRGLRVPHMMPYLDRVARGGRRCPKDRPELPGALARPDQVDAALALAGATPGYCRSENFGASWRLPPSRSSHRTAVPRDD